ncbi:hypothetical protein [Wenyingzhuangia sp. 2_MG-2023]|uniref:hypothetical protein n=1 Tax=Wenyingzhuangia sp. 2_MG-2023 TaxID=3062639 RepID=UPI0026E2F0A6|nr:hypothetical protein [Wenyingzhuangia sp. 2_MG-2023]MDO6737116.1 hypothetical protein [Wenyingzhuangia sp. 2_MG-2023]
MMENKYYTPSLEEFHVGFEYSYKSNLWGYLDCTKGYWALVEFSAGSSEGDLSEIQMIQNAIDSESDDIEVRVKHLDHEDIESLGFKLVSSDWYHNNNDENPFQILKSYNKENEYHISSGTHEHNKTLFNGVIKNKSELKRLLKQLKIID